MGSLIHPICGLPLAMFSYGNTISSIQICNMVVNSIHMSMEEFVNETSKKILLYEIDNVINTITTNYRKKIYCIPGNIRPPSPVLYLPIPPSLSEGEFSATSDVSNHLAFLFTTLSGRIHDGAKPLASGKGRK